MELSEIYKSSFKSIYIVENRNLWNNVVPEKATDVVFCLDFGLFHQLESEGYNVAYLDHLVDRTTADQFNAEMHYYIQNWFRDGQNNDLLHHKDYDFGDSLIMDVLNDITYPCHFFINLIQLKKLTYEKLYVIADEIIIKEILQEINIDFESPQILKNSNKIAVYYFPIIKWTNDQINPSTLKSKIRKVVSRVLDFTLDIFDLFEFKAKKTIYIQNHYPTEPIIQALLDDKNIRIILGDYIPQKNILKQRRIKFRRQNCEFEVAELLNSYKISVKLEWTYQNVNLSKIIQKKISIRLKEHIEKAISLIENIDRYFETHLLNLMIPVTNLLTDNRLIIHYCKKKNIPVFMIINGLLTARYWQEAHDSTWVNCYSESLKEDYFKGANFALPIGDPRMDTYINKQIKVINRKEPTILIGSAGYNHLDQTSYLAFEFDFLYDILNCITRLKDNSYESDLILKVRSNGYAHLYDKFLDEYFPNLKITVIQHDPFPSVVVKADLYVTFYSQTIMEAAALGIPTIYYKKDESFSYRPYDETTELVTALDMRDLEIKIKMFYENDTEFERFIHRETLEKYIGHLDGKNLERNIKFIHYLLNMSDLKKGS